MSDNQIWFRVTDKDSDASILVNSNNVDYICEADNGEARIKINMLNRRIACRESYNSIEELLSQNAIVICGKINEKNL